MIKQLELKNWKSFQSGKLYIDPLTILIGTNASGKSNVLDALSLLQMLTLGKSIQAAMAGDMESQGLRGGHEWAILRGQNEASLRLEVGAAEQGESYTYEVILGRNTENQLELIGESLLRTRWNGNRAYEKTMFDTSPSTMGEPSIAAHFHTGKQGRRRRIDLRRTHTVLSQSQLLTLQSDVKQAIETVSSQLNKIFLLDPIPSLIRDYVPLSDVLRADASNLAGVLAALPSEKKKEVEGILSRYLSHLPERDIVKVWAEKVGRFNQDAMLYCQEDTASGPMDMDARALSDGTLRFIAIMTAVLTIQSDSLLIIEEVDNGFHPSRAQLLVRFLRELGKKRNIDIICTTHNPAFLDALGNSMIVFISLVYRDMNTGHSAIKLLEEIDTLPRIIGQGSLGYLSTAGKLEAAAKI